MLTSLKYPNHSSFGIKLSTFKTPSFSKKLRYNKKFTHIENISENMIVSVCAESFPKSSIFVRRRYIKKDNINTNESELVNVKINIEIKKRSKYFFLFIFIKQSIAKKKREITRHRLDIEFIVSLK